MALFGKGKPSKTQIPINQVVSMRQQGITNNQIIQTLQRDGFSSSQIFEAMNQADMTPAVSEVSSNEIKEDQMVQFKEEPQEPQGQSFNYQPSYNQEPSFQQPRENSPSPQFQNEVSGVEELVESVIEEKWTDIVKDINRIIAWKNKVDSRMSAIERDFLNLKDEFDKLHQAVIGKIGEYDKNILTVGAEVKAMEKVFSKVLPVFTENVNTLSRISDSLKKK